MFDTSECWQLSMAMKVSPRNMEGRRGKETIVVLR